MIAALAKLAADKNYGGYVFDLENLSAASVAALPQFVSAVQAVFKPAHLETWPTVPLGFADWPIKAIQDAGGTVVLMAYDQCWANSTPGPIAGDDWFGPTLAARMQGIDPSKTIIALGSYAYDWPKGMPAKVLSIDQASQLAYDNNSSVTRTKPQSNPVFTYTAADGTPHVVWMLDGETFARQSATASSYNVIGIALWRLGFEDASVWKKSDQATRIGSRNAGQPLPVCFLLPTK
jgi:spore germination protein YaaH